MDQTHSFLAIVDDPLEPGLALDVDELTARHVGELDSDSRADQVGPDLVREKSHGHTLVVREVGDAGQSFLVGGVFSVALDVDSPGLVRVLNLGH